ncbi:MAG: T9SS type A sorting domain-containing protein [Ignavibacteriales bacterium]|nr:T9SS type A sorting domain-containing protein [Ignavibacteriales bacterium]
MKFLRVLVFFYFPIAGLAQTTPYYLNGFFVSQYFREQVKTINFDPEVRIVINAPAPEKFNPALPTSVSLFALPNGNTIEQTIGKVLKTGDDWHFDIQHIGAQTRFLREKITDRNMVTVYLESKQLSWPSWRTKYANNAALIKTIVDSMQHIFAQFNPSVTLTGHSGGGSFTFGYMNAVTTIPNTIERIAFLDSDYNYDDTNYGPKIKNWVAASPNNYLCVIAYNDSIALYNGQPIVSPTGGTWYRSKLMAAYLSNYFTITTTTDSVFITYLGLNRRICFLLKQNPLRQILHTVQVEKNGYIQGMLSGTPLEGIGYTYYGARAYTAYIQSVLPTPLQIPPRQAGAKTGSQFMQYVNSMTFTARESAIYTELAAGNVPDFMRTLKKLTSTFADVNGTNHTVEYEVSPDYVCIGSNEDFCRIPMGPITAQRIANLYGAVMPTAKLVDDIYAKAELKLAPVTYAPVGNQNEQVVKFVEHNTAIEQQRIASGKPLGTLIGGTKKDVILSNLITDPTRPDHVVIYGWHQLSGLPIQPVTNIHANAYVDYSHGIRYINSELMLDGNIATVKQILTSTTLYKVLSNESALMAQPSYLKDSTLPVQPKSFGFIPIDSTSLQLVIKRDSSLINYKAYLSNDGIAYNDSLVVAVDNPVLTGLEKEKLYFIKIKAVNNFGSSVISEALAGMPSAKAPDVLVVNGFDRITTTNTYNFIRNIAPEFKQQNKIVASCTNDAVLAGLINLSTYKSVAYILGEESTVDETFSTAEQEKVKSYLKQGGNLLATGAEIAWDLDTKGAAADKDFCYNFLKMQYVADAPNGVAGSVYQASSYAPPFGSIPGILFDNGTHGTIDVKYPDVIKGINGGKLFMSYQNVDTATGGAAVYFQGLFTAGTKPGRLIVMGYPFEAIYTAAQRTQLMQKFVQFFDSPIAIDPNTGLVLTYGLEQNYPNPFNPVTRVRYSFPYSAKVTIKVHDLLGREMVTLVDSFQQAGIHEIDFNASSFSSGVYFYRITVGGFSEVKKMMVLK